MKEKTGTVSLTVDGDHLTWAGRCHARLHERPFKFVASEDVGGGTQLLASYAGLLHGPIGYVTVEVHGEGVDRTRLDLTANVQAENPFQALITGSSDAMLKKLQGRLLRP